jgi:hypothetical protein
MIINIYRIKMKPVIKLMDQKSNLSHIAKKYYNLEYIELLLFCFLLCFTFFSFFAIFQITEYSRKTNKSIHKIGFIHYIYIYLAGRDTYMFKGSDEIPCKNYTNYPICFKFEPSIFSFVPQIDPSGFHFNHYLSYLITLSDCLFFFINFFYL